MAIRPFRPVRAALGGARSGSEADRAMKQIAEQFARWTAHMSEQSGEVLRAALEPTFQKALTYCPRKTGALRASGYLEVRRVGVLRGWQAEIGFGRGGFPHYTVLVHELPNYHTPPTRWKWLQYALQEDGDEIRRRLTEGIKTASGT